MGLIPVQLGLVHFSVGETNQRKAFEFAPAPAAEDRFQFIKFSDRKIDRDNLDIGDLADQLEVFAHIDQSTNQELREQLASARERHLLARRASTEPQVNFGRIPSPQKSGLPNAFIRCPMPWARDKSNLLCGTLGYLIERPMRKSRPLPTSTNVMLSSVCELPLPSSLVQTMSVLSNRLPLPPGSGVSARRLARYANCSQYQRLIRVRLSWDSWSVSGLWDSSWWLSAIFSQRMRACPTKLVDCTVATTAKSAAKLLTISSICILLVRGMLSFSFFTPGSSSGTACPTS